MIVDYIKSFKEWFKLKISLWNSESKVIFKQGDIWWCSLGVNLGEEIFGKGLKFTRHDADLKKVRSRFLEFYGS